MNDIEAAPSDPSIQRVIREAAQSAVPQLKAALKDKEYWVRQSAASALARIGEMQMTRMRAR